MSNINTQRAVHTAASSRTQRFSTCPRHGWRAVNVPCPECKADAPTQCEKHGWTANGVGCPKCKKGEL